MKLRVILDTNVFISGLFWEGNYCSQIISAWRAEKFILISSIEIIEELIETLREFKIQMPAKMIGEWQKMIIDNAIIVVPQQRFDIVKSDSDDNKFFEVAVAGHADYIVSQDKHHLLVGTFQGIKVLRPEEFLRIIR